MKIRIASLMLFCLAFMPLSSAQVLYDDGPINGMTNAYTINFGYVVSDTITLNHNATVGGFDLGVWEYLRRPDPDGRLVDHLGTVRRNYIRNGDGLRHRYFHLGQPIRI